MQSSSIYPIGRALSGATILGHSGPGSDGSEGVVCISQNSSITGTSASDISYLGHLLGIGGSYPSAEVKLVYSAAAIDWAPEMKVIVQVRQGIMIIFPEKYKRWGGEKKDKIILFHIPEKISFSCN